MTSIDGERFQIARDMFAADTASRSLGIEVVELGPGHATTRFIVTEAMVNGHGTTHGGYIFLFADTTFALACNSHDLRAVAARADIRFIRPTGLGDVLTARAVERIRYGRNGIYDVTVTDQAMATVAEFRGDSRVVP
ncbi:hydroxyphenylacetyl-CoA thioesterase PaaI [Rhodococcus sp. ACT016]|uniref:hydroxyphenylacetyl-CoA thioesterase PaaI n=1 Tax=Rhodococcus sp. ACT016 TaxID=3134808 RepID=UPI003D28AAF0